ncbi:hypothetical protein ACLOJK_002499 [Asimina triloba]
MALSESTDYQQVLVVVANACFVCLMPLGKKETVEKPCPPASLPLPVSLKSQNPTSLSINHPSSLSATGSFPTTSERRRQASTVAALWPGLLNRKAEKNPSPIFFISGSGLGSHAYLLRLRQLLDLDVLNSVEQISESISSQAEQTIFVIAGSSWSSRPEPTDHCNFSWALASASTPAASSAPVTVTVQAASSGLLRIPADMSFSIASAWSKGMSHSHSATKTVRLLCFRHDCCVGLLKLVCLSIFLKQSPGLARTPQQMMGLCCSGFFSQQQRTFIQMRTNLKVVDNSGAKRAMCIQALKGKKGARLGDTIIASVKEAQPRGKVKKGEVVYGVVVRAAMQRGRCDGSEIRFDDNAVVLVNKQGEPIGTRVFGPVPHELRKKKHVKILTLAEHIA